MPGFDPALCAYTAPDGRTVRLGVPAVVPDVAVATTTYDRVTTAQVTVSGQGAELADVSAAKWRVTPNPATYATTLTGETAVFKHDGTAGGASQVTVSIPRSDGGPDITHTVTVTHSTRGTAGMFPRTFTRGGEALKVEAAFGFEAARTGVPCRLIRDASPGVPSERTVIETRTVDFPAQTGVPLSRSITFPAAPGKVGEGYEYHWEADLAPGHTVRSKTMPVWVLGDDPSTAPQPLSIAPATLNYPGIYTRRASDSGQVTPAAGKTYQQHLDAFYRDWRADNLGQPVGGAWLSFNDYYANIYWIDLDDTSVPRHRIQHWDWQQMGWTYTGWYGSDGAASPYPRSNVAIDVPIPNNAMSSIGTDRSLCIVGMRNGQVEKIWELWLAVRNADGSWQAATIAVTTAADRWRHSRSYTVAASGISALAYALRYKEAASAVAYVKAQRAAGQPVSDAEIVARVPHALAINQPFPYANAVSYPATFTDGASSDTAAAWEGQLVYLRQNLDVTALNLTPLKHVIAVVGKHRGFRVTDKTSWSTTLIVEGDQSYGGGLWSQLMEPGESWVIDHAKSDFVIGKQYTSEAAFDADTTT